MHGVMGGGVGGGREGDGGEVGRRRGGRWGGGGGGEDRRGGGGGQEGGWEEGRWGFANVRFRMNFRTRIMQQFAGEEFHFVTAYVGQSEGIHVRTDFFFFTRVFAARHGDQQGCLRVYRLHRPPRHEHAEKKEVPHHGAVQIPQEMDDAGGKQQRSRTDSAGNG